MLRDKVTSEIMSTIIVKNSKIHGLGVFAGRDFKQGEVVLNWNAKKLNPEEVTSLSDADRHFLSYLDDGTPVLVGKPARYLNHSCDPNTEAHNDTDIAIRDIKTDEEITGNYNTEGVAPDFKCTCGNCKID